ncbi:prolyl oligopeptidase family serine peptidase [Prosthecobacter sp.]|uniref:carboxylesterase family protein n=1 Tax=Prosthecobacter sp. TaxID=1965333 RepID=UPI003784D4E0
MHRPLFFCLSLLLTATLPCQAREWTSSDGRKIQGDFVSASATDVTVKMAGKDVRIPLSRLSAGDQAWVKEQAGKPAAGAGKPIEGAYGSLITGDWALSKFKDLPFALYGATELDAAKKYPLVLVLHGKSPNDENGKQIGGWTKSFTTQGRYAKNPCIVVAPLCYQPFGITGSGWGDKPGVEAVALVKELLKALPIDKDRVYCVGYSMGGFGTCHLINAEPRLFAAGVAVAGCSGPETADTFKKVPLWLFHAADDANVKVDYSRALAEALKRDKDCKYTEYPTGGHGIVGKVFEEEEMHTWLFAKGVAGKK